MSQGWVVFSHGKDSEPWGVKIRALAETARAEGYAVESVDYRGIDSPEARTARLIDTCKSVRGDLVLVGSSLGGYVTLSAAAALHACGVFLMAPAIYMEGLPLLRPGGCDCPVTIVHGLQDEVVPVDHSVRYAREHDVILHLLHDDHRLHRSLPFVRTLFEYFLVQLDMPRVWS
jgi:predicted alpha/beta-hydrolase family hydrolase